MKVLKILIPSVLIIMLLGGFLYTSINSKKIVLNDTNTTGNTSGNLNNGGLFCELEDTIYFSNPKDNGFLYQMDINGENFKKLSDDRVSYLNAAGPYLYYTRKNNTDNNNSSFKVFSFNVVGIYRMKRDGSQLRQLYREDNGIMSLSGNHIYFQFYNLNEGIELHRVRIDDRETEKILKESISPAAVHNNKLYYTGAAKDHNIHVMDLNSKSTSTIYEGNCYNVTYNNNYLYFIDIENGYGITRIEMDGSNPEQLVKEQCSTFNVSMDGSYLYYQTDKSDTNRICRMDLDTLESETIMNGNYTNINITSRQVFFEEFKSKRTYYMPIGDSLSVKEFNPPVIGKDK